LRQTIYSSPDYFDEVVVPDPHKIIRAGSAVFSLSNLLLAGMLIFLSPAAYSQGPEMPPSPVRYTEARRRPVRDSVVLSGTVETPTRSLVAGEVAGMVAEFLVREGETVEKGQPLARLRTATLELDRSSVEAQLREAQARLKQAEAHLDRARELLEAGVMPRDQFDDRFFEVDAWRGRVEQLTANIARINGDIERSVIFAPFAGVVAAERTEVGQWLSIGAPVVEIISVSELEVRVDVPERYFQNLRTGGTTSVTFDALPGTNITGRIQTILPAADPQARTFPLKISIPNPGGRIGVGMLAQVSFPIGQSVQATIVPKDALVRRGPQQLVFLMNGEGTVNPVPVETGQAVGSWVEVRGPVQPGMKVVTRGNERLQPGQSVRGEVQEYPLP
jgi:RND family efflux transporter MFP subunit